MKRKRQMMPRPNVPLLMDRDLARMLKAWWKIKAMVDAQATARGKKKWTRLQYDSTCLWLYGEAQDKIAERLLLLYDAQYPASMYVR